METVNIVWGLLSFTIYIILRLLQLELNKVNIEFLYQWKNQNLAKEEVVENIFKKQELYKNSISVFSIVFLVIFLIELQYIFLYNFEYSLTNSIYLILFTILTLGTSQFILLYAAPKFGMKSILKTQYLIRSIGLIYMPIDRIFSKITSNNENKTDESNSNTESLSIQLDDQGELLEEHEVRMIKGVFELDKKVVREIMIPRVDMTSAEINTPISEIADNMLSTGHSKIPVYSEELDKIKGIIHSMDILQSISDMQNLNSEILKNKIRPVIFVPESKTLEDLLTEFQEKRMQMAIVVDEYGGVSGLVTVEDVVEEIVGELHDEFDTGEAQVTQINTNEFRVDARTPTDELSEQLGIDFTGIGYDTIGGFVLNELGKIPSPGDSFNYNETKIEVLSTIGRRLKHIKIHLQK
ncbi:MAG: hemolysin family protein [SAR202 cluster bacterium]|nr:hemolysin family protein [SAR202 cluster bacterium]